MDTLKRHVHTYGYKHTENVAIESLPRRKNKSSDFQVNDHFNEEIDEKPIKQLLLPMPQAKNSDKMFKVLESVSHKMPGKTCRRSKLGVDYVFDLYDLFSTMGN